MCKVIKDASMERACKPSFAQICYCGTPTNSFKMISDEMDSVRGGTNYTDTHLDMKKKVIFLADLVYIIMMLCELPFS